ncbi:MAG: DUF3276 family protein [Ginsengibacter sp.]
MAYDNNDKKMESVYSQRIRAGKRRTYFFDVRETRGNDYYLTITESRKKFNEDGYDRHKIFLYKEDFNKFLKGMTEAIDYVKTELMPDFDFDAFNHDNDNYEGGNYPAQNKESNYSSSPSNEENETSSSSSAAPQAEDTSSSASSDDDSSDDDDNNNATQHEEVDKW